MGKSLARILLEVGAVVLRPDDMFLWSSGIKSPIYVDNRLLLSHVPERDAILKVIQKKYWDLKELPFGAIAGTSTAGIPWGSILADKFSVPFVYVRGKAKEHGKENKVEGKVWPDVKYLVVEDLISTAGSAVATAEAVRSKGGLVQSIVSIFSYELRISKVNLKEAKLKLSSLVTLDVVLNSAVRLDRITPEQRTFIRNWREELNKG